jgi:hypothetical protein
MHVTLAFRMYQYELEHVGYHTAVLGVQIS